MSTKTSNEIVIDMAEEVQFTTEKDYIEDIVSKIENKKIYIDPRYQRRNSWNKENQKNFIDSIYKNMVSHSIILVNIGASYHIALQKNRHKDADYFKELLDKGYEYISIDGNNRSQTITKYKNGEIGVKYSHDKDKSLFLKKKLSVTTYSSMSLLQMHELGIKVNQGQPWNRQEQRNCINSMVADTIREISTKFNNITEKINVKKTRMYDDELLVMLLFYETNKRGGTQDSWDTMYKKESADLSGFKKVINEWGKVLSHHPNKKKLDKSFVYNLYTLLSYLNEYNVSINKDGYKKFLEIYHQQETLRKNEKRALYLVNEEQKTWGDLCRLVASNIEIRLGKILQDISPLLDTLTIQKDSKRSFSFSDKVNIWVNSEGMIRINGQVGDEWYNNQITETHKYVSLLEVMDGEKYVVDHVLPHKDGNKTVLSNGEITTREYNLWKSGRVPQYV